MLDYALAFDMCSEFMEFRTGLVQGRQFHAC